jgi:hypothetical protein
LSKANQAHNGHCGQQKTREVFATVATHLKCSEELLVDEGNLTTDFTDDGNRFAILDF